MHLLALASNRFLIVLRLKLVTAAICHFLVVHAFREGIFFLKMKPFHFGKKFVIFKHSLKPDYDLKAVYSLILFVHLYFIRMRLSEPISQHCCLFSLDDEAASYLNDYLLINVFKKFAANLKHFICGCAKTVSIDQEVHLLCRQLSGKLNQKDYELQHNHNCLQIQKPQVNYYQFIKVQISQMLNMKSMICIEHTLSKMICKLFLDFLDIIAFKNMSKHLIQNYQSFSGISGIGANHQSLMNEPESKQEIFYTIKINGPAQGTSSMVASGSRREEESAEKGQKSVSHKNPFTLETTGYEINRELYSDDQIREAFQVIDINKDGVLSSDDLSFFLRCMGQEFTPEEVQQMISIVSTDGKGVLLDDFKKIGKGKIIPFAGIRLPDPTAPLKQTVLNNLSQSGLIDLDPQQLLIAEEAKYVSHAKFQVQRSRRYEQVEPEEIEAVDQEAPLLRNRTHAEILQKRTEVSLLHMLNVERIIENLNQCGRQHLQSRDIAQLITINEHHARQLFTDPFKRVFTKQVVLDSILFSSKPPLVRLELVLQNLKTTDFLSFEKWLDVLVYMLGIDQRELVKRKLVKLLNYKNVKLDCPFEKQYIVILMASELSSFNW